MIFGSILMLAHINIANSGGSGQDKSVPSVFAHTHQLFIGLHNVMTEDIGMQ